MIINETAVIPAKKINKLSPQLLRIIGQRDMAYSIF
jgi:hypothetical protein